MTLGIAIATPTLVVIGVVTVVLLRRRLRIVTVQGASMQPTLAAGDQLLVRRATLSRVRSGDIVVLATQTLDADAFAFDTAPAGPPFPDGAPVSGPPLPPDSIGSDRHPDSATLADYGKVVSEAGDWVIKRAVAVPGDPVPVSVMSAVNASPGAMVPEGVFVALGDNQDASFDSRSYGYVAADALLGVAVRPFRSRNTAPGQRPKNWRERQWSTS